MKNAKAKSAVYNDERQISNFVFPDGSWGGGPPGRQKTKKQATIEEAGASFIERYRDRGSTVGFGKYVDYNFNNTTFSIKPRSGFSEQISSLDGIKELSEKYYNVVKLLMEKPGNAFVYSELVFGSGAIVLALCLEAMGFERYNEHESVFISSHDNTVKPFCAGNDKSIRRIDQKKCPKRLRYALFTAGSKKYKDSIFETMNSYENRHGEYIKVLIASDVGKEGINIRNVLSIHLLAPEWHQSGMYQSVSRGLRADSHDDLLQEEQEKLDREAARKSRKPERAKIVVSIYKHCSIFNPDGVKSIDLMIYDRAQEKDKKTKRILHMMKQCAVGCEVHHKRNTAGKTEDYSPDCDYEVCDYKCVDFQNTGKEEEGEGEEEEEEGEDLSAYDVVYSGKLIKSISDRIVSMFKRESGYHFDKIDREINNPKYVLMALERLINERTPIYDKFGIVGLLKECNSFFYLVRSYDKDNSRFLPYYTKSLIVKKHLDLNVILEVKDYEENKDILNELEKMDPGSEDFIDRLKSLSRELQAFLIEQAIKKKYGDLKKKDKVLDTILDHFSYFIFQTHEPVKHLKEAIDKELNKTTKPGRPEGEGANRKIKVMKGIEIKGYEMEENTPEIFLHTIYSQNKGQTEYNTDAAINKGEGIIRLLKGVDGEWRSLGEIESKVYNRLVQVLIERRKTKYKEQGIYGTVNGGFFKIVDMSKQREKADTDSRYKVKGVVCDSGGWSVAALRLIMWKIRAPEKIIHTNSERVMNEVLEREHGEDVANWGIEQKKYLYNLHVIGSNYTKKIMCGKIRAHLEATGRILNIL